MKRQLIAIVMGSLFALPALANNEIDAGNLPQHVSSGKTTAQVRAELIAAQRAGQMVANAELGTPETRPVQMAGKSTEQVFAELIRARQSGNWILNAELGTRG